MRRYVNILMMVMVAVVLASCSANPDLPKRKHAKRPFMVAASSGNPYEVMVVAEDSMWNGYAGKALRVVLNKDVPMLPQREPMFHVSHITPSKFNRITNLFRNIVILKTNEYTTKPQINYERDVYSSPQLIMTIQGPSAKELSTFITEQTRTITQNLTAEEINRNAMLLEDDYNIAFYRKCKEMFGCELFIPQDLLKMKVGEDFLWASNDGLSTIQNICIYSYPYVSEKVFTHDNFIKLRDLFMEKNIPGAEPGQYMATNADYVLTRPISIMGRYVLEARGFWTMKNDMMGGPFVSHSTVDTVNNRVVVVEGFVYAPEKMKRTMIRRLESALYTLRLPEKRVEKTPSK